METTRKRKRTRSPKKSGAEHKEAQRKERVNQTRRNLYASDLAYKKDCKEYSRKYYRENSGIAGDSKLKDGLLVDPVNREVFHPHTGNPANVAAYATGRACEALGKARMTVLKWQKDGIIPMPRLEDVARPYKYYSEGELKLIATIVTKWEQHYKYLTVKNVELIEEMTAQVEKYRKTKV